MISIVDDDASVREATKGLVRSLGYSAATFASADEFLASDRVADTSCLISDVQMPGLSGLELQHHLADRGHCVPIVFITAYLEEKVREQAMEAGAIAFLDKPFSDEQLIVCLDAALRKQSRGYN